MKTLRIGFIGSGGMADAHLKGLADSALFPEVALAAFCDIAIERAQAQSDKYASHSDTKPLAFSDPRTMIAEAGLDAVYILLPPFAHGEAERAAIEGNVPFLVEKPIGLDLGVLRELRAEVQRKDLMAAAGYMNRYQPSVKRAREVMGQDEAVLAYGWWLGGAPLHKEGSQQSFIMQWWPDRTKSGGQFHEQVTHTVDLVRHFLGDAQEVYAHATTSFNKKRPNLVPSYNMDDALTTSIKFKSGALASILASVATPAGGGIQLDVHGMETSVKFNGWGHDATILRKDAEPEVVKSADGIFAIEDRAFLDAVASGDRSSILAPYVDSFKTAQLTIAANQSAQTGKPVELDD